MLTQLHQQLHDERRGKDTNGNNGNGNSVVVGGPGQQRRFLIVGGRVGFPKPEKNTKETECSATVSSTTVSSTEASAAQ